MSTKGTKADKAQRQAERLDKRLDERLEEDEKNKGDRDPRQADVDSIKH